MNRVVAHRLEEIEVSILTDGAANMPPELFPGTDPGDIEALLSRQGEGEIRTNYNAVLIRTGGRVVLADAGPRDLLGPTCGNLAAALTEAGVEPAEIDTFFATHLHPDHIAGGLTPEGDAAFPNAALVVTEADHAFWSGEIPGADDMVKAWQKLAQTLLAAYGERLQLVRGEAEIAPGVTALPLPGHTPGHSGFRVASGSEQLVHVGDIVHAPALQLANPEIAVAFDVDAEAARAARKRLLDELASEATPVTGGHLLQPAIGRVERHGGGYRLMRD